MTFEKIIIKNSSMDNVAAQADEIEALCSIYGSDWKTEDGNYSYSIKICEACNEITAYIKLSPEYPSQSPPDIQISAPSLSRMQKQEIALALDDIYLENIGEAVLYQWIEKVREILRTFSKNNLDKTDRIDQPITTKVKNMSEPVIQHGPIIQDRKSIFQGHVAGVHSLKNVDDIVEYLMENKKIADATHNITAYRIQGEKGNILQDFNDDGETQAGRRLLHLLQIVDATNVLVVVSRWYGGVQLGPDRFRHINNAARQVMEQAGYIVKKK